MQCTKYTEWTLCYEVVRLSVRLSVTLMCCAQTTERIKLPFRVRLPQALWHYCITSGPDPQKYGLGVLPQNLIDTFKILTGKERIYFKKFFKLAGHSLKLYKPRCHTTLRQNFFSIRVINEWNKLPQSVIKAPSVNAFKNRLDKYWSDDYIWHGYTIHQPRVQVYAPGIRVVPGLPDWKKVNRMSIS